MVKRLLERLRDLTSVAQFVAETCNLSVPNHHPYTGASAFAHKGGLHASAIARFPEAYEHTRPEAVGNTQRMLVSELAGKASLIAKAKNLGIDLAQHPDKTQEILDRVLTPMGTVIKRNIVEELADRRESMGVCFLEGRPCRDFLRSRDKTEALRPGPIIDIIAPEKN